MRERRGRRGLEDLLPSLKDTDDVSLALALDELRWFERRCRSSRLFYRLSELLLLLTTVATTLAAAFAVRPVVTASLAALTALLTGFRQLFDPHGRLIRNVVAWTDLRELVLRYALEGRHGSGSQKRLLQLVNDISRQETGEWLSVQQLRRSTRMVSEPQSSNSRGGQPVGKDPAGI